MGFGFQGHDTSSDDLFAPTTPGNLGAGPPSPGSKIPYGQGGGYNNAFQYGGYGNVTQPNDYNARTGQITPVGPDGDPSTPVYQKSGAQDAVSRYQSMGQGMNNQFAQRGNYNAGQIWQYGANTNAQDQGYANDVANRQAPSAFSEAGGIDRGLGMGARGDQTGALALARSAAMGQAPSAAQQMMQQGSDAAVRSQLQLAGGARGPGGLAAAQYNAAGNIAGLQQQNAAQQGTLRAQEMAQARDAYGNLAGTIRGQDMGQQAQDVGQAQFNANLALQSRGENDQTAFGYRNLGQQQQAGLLQMGLNNQLGNDTLGAQNQMGYEQLGSHVNDEQLQAQMAQQAMLNGNNQFAQQLAFQQGQANFNNTMQVVGAGLGLASGAVGVPSDERLKTAVHLEGTGAGRTMGMSDADVADRMLPPEDYAYRGRERTASGGSVESYSPEHHIYVKQAERTMGTGRHEGRAYSIADHIRSYLPSDVGLKTSVVPAGAPPRARPMGGGYLPSPLTAAAYSGGGIRGFSSNQPIGMDRHASMGGLMSDAAAKRDAREEGRVAGLNEAAARMGAGLRRQFATDSPIVQHAQDSRGAAPAQMMDRLQPVSYNYKPGSGQDPAPRRYGVMAQDLEQSPMGASVVHDTPIGKMIDVPQATGVQFAALANLHDRLGKIERRDPYSYYDGIEHSDPYGEGQ